MPRYQCKRWWWGCQYSVSRKDRRRKHQEKCKVVECRSLSIPLFKLLKEHHDLSCDIKWLSLAHDFGKNINFFYEIEGGREYGSLYIIFEDSSHLINFDHPNERIRRSYGFILSGRYIWNCLEPFSAFYTNNERHWISLCDYSYRKIKHGCLKDIFKCEIQFIIKKYPGSTSEKFAELSSIESIEKKKNELHIIRKKIDEILFPFLIEYFPRDLIPIITDYFL